MADYSPSHAEKNYDDVTQHSKTYLVGLCSGLFAAAAIASTPYPSALVPVAVQAVLQWPSGPAPMSHELAERLNPTFETSGKLTYILPSSTEEEVSSKITDFHNQRVSEPGFIPQFQDERR